MAASEQRKKQMEQYIKELQRRYSNEKDRLSTITELVQMNGDIPINNLTKYIRQLPGVDGRAAAFYRKKGILGKHPTDDQEFFYCEIKTSYDEKTFFYLSDRDDLAVGDVVIVEFGYHGETEAKIVSIRKCLGIDAPYPPENTKAILRKKGERPGKQLSAQRKEQLVYDLAGNPDYRAIDKTVFNEARFIETLKEITSANYEYCQLRFRGYDEEVQKARDYIDFIDELHSPRYEFVELENGLSEVILDEADLYRLEKKGIRALLKNFPALKITGLRENWREKAIEAIYSGSGYSGITECVEVGDFTPDDDGGDGRWASYVDMMQPLNTSFIYAKTGDEIPVLYTYPYRKLWNDNMYYREEKGIFYEETNPPAIFHNSSLAENTTAPNEAKNTLTQAPEPQAAPTDPKVLILDTMAAESDCFAIADLLQRAPVLKQYSPQKIAVTLRELEAEGKLVRDPVSKTVKYYVKDAVYKEVVHLTKNCKLPSKLQHAIDLAALIPGYLNVEEYCSKCREKMQLSAYETAVKQYEAAQTIEEYTQAAAAFAEFGTYKDSAELLEKCAVEILELKYAAKYAAAVELYNKAQTPRAYSQAEEAFAQLGGYKDSAELRQTCLVKRQELINASIYATAIKAMADAQTPEEYLTAADAFAALEKYRDAAAKSEECKRNAEKIIENQRKDHLYEAARAKASSDNVTVLQQAEQEFASITNWRDAEKQAENCRSRIEYIQAEQQKAERRAQRLCQHCGGEFKGFFTRTCRACGRKKDY